MKFLLNRKLINPVLFTSGLLTLTSGILLLCEFEPDPVIIVHELAAILLAVTGGLHLAINWKALRFSLRGSMWVCLALVALCSVLMLASVRPWLEEMNQNPDFEGVIQVD